MVDLLIPEQSKNNSHNWIYLQKDIEEGLAVDNVKYLKEKYSFTDKSIANFLGVSTRTILRRKNNKLTPEESEKLYKLFRIINKAEKIMGSPETVLAWMTSRNPSLEGYIPLKICSNIVGYEEVINLLEKMKWGIP